MMSTSIWELVFDAILKREFDISVSGGNDAAWGFALCVLALLYHLINSGIYDALQHRATQDRTIQEVAHDRAIFTMADGILNEKQLDSIISQLLTDHSMRFSDTSQLEKFSRQLAEIGNTFLRPSINDHTQELLKAFHKLSNFTANKFDMFPYHQNNDNYRICMAPNLNCDRAGNCSQETMKQYDILTNDLASLINDVQIKYNAWRLNLKRQLVI